MTGTGDAGPASGDLGTEPATAELPAPAPGDLGSETETAEVPASASGRGAAGSRRRAVVLRSVAALAVGISVGLLLHASGWMADARDTLVVMGFDPDRGQLLASLLAGGIAAAIAVVLFGTRRTGVAIGAAVSAAFFAHTFVTETRGALAVTAAGSRIDPSGWILTLVTLAVTAVGVGWIAATLALDARRLIGHALGVVVESGRSRKVKWRDAMSPLGVAVALAVLVVTVPILGDILNYGPTTHMTTGAGGPVALFGSSPAPGAPAESPGPMPSPGLQVSTGSVNATRPWLAWTPTGSGRVVSTSLPAPWSGGTRSSIAISVYLPPGYETGTRRYPVLYEAPFALGLWQGGVGFAGTMDSLINGGQLPPQIAVFVSHNGGPYPVSECADSFDGREQLDTFVATTLVRWVDATYRTIADPAARALFGFSEGGFCATNLLFRHPDVFRQAVSFSGYFVAGMASSQTINAWRPWGGQPGLIDANSPLKVAARTPTSIARTLFVVLSGSRTDAPYGPQLVDFAKALADAGVPHAILAGALGHSWREVGDDLPTALALVAARQVQLGVYRPGP